MRFHGLRRRLGRYDQIELNVPYREQITGQVFYVRSIGPQITCETAMGDEFSTPRTTFETALWTGIIKQMSEEN